MCARALVDLNLASCWGDGVEMRKIYVAIFVMRHNEEMCFDGDLYYIRVYDSSLG